MHKKMRQALLSELKKGSIVRFKTNAIHQETQKPLDRHIGRVVKINNNSDIHCYFQMRGKGYIVQFSLDELLIKE
jgi:hypothetical protein